MKTNISTLKVLSLLTLFLLAYHLDAKDMLYNSKQDYIDLPDNNMYLTLNQVDADNAPRMTLLTHEVRMNNEIYSTREYTRLLAEISSLPRYTEMNKQEFNFLFDEGPQVKNKKKKVSAIVFQGTSAQERILDEIINITNDEGYKAHIKPGIMPLFKGGYQKMIEYLNHKVDLPDDMRKEELSGSVLLGFIVEKDGSIGHIKILESANPVLDQQAYQLVKSMPKWHPGMEDRHIPVFINIQLIFRP